MMKEKQSEMTEKLNEIEAAVYQILKPKGFRKYGRTLHRFVSEDISQVINFQRGQAYRNETHFMWVNLGIRVPECDERKLILSGPMKKYYRESVCTMRSRLGEIDGEKEKCFNLNDNAAKITSEIIDDIENKVLPVYDILSTREAILAHRREYPHFDTMQCNLILEEAMIYGHLGDMDKAKELFEMYYQNRVDDYNDKMINGRQEYLKKGHRIVYMKQDITAEEDGYVTIYGANHGYIDYLDELALSLGLR